MITRVLNRLIVAAILLLLVLILSAWQVPTELATPCMFLAWAGTTAGIAVILGILESVAVEYISAWPAIPSKWKCPILALAALVVSLLVLAGKSLLCGLAIDTQFVWEAITAAGLVFTANQIWYKRTQEGSRESRILAARPKTTGSVPTKF